MSRSTFLRARPIASRATSHAPSSAAWSCRMSGPTATISVQTCPRSPERYRSSHRDVVPPPTRPDCSLRSDLATAPKSAIGPWRRGSPAALDALRQFGSKGVPATTQALSPPILEPRRPPDHEVRDEAKVRIREPFPYIARSASVEAAVLTLFQRHAAQDLSLTSIGRPPLDCILQYWPLRVGRARPKRQRQSHPSARKPLLRIGQRPDRVMGRR